MTRRTMWAVLAITTAVGLLYLVGCGGSGTTFDAGGATGPAVETPIGASDLAAADATASAEVTPLQTAGPTLTLRLTTGLETYGTQLITQINGAVLYRGTTSRTATISSGAAVFELTGLVKGFYNIRINGLGTAVLPTKIDDPTLSMTQYVTKTLTDSVIGTLTNPKYRFRTYPGAQAQHRTVKYSDGTEALPLQYAYLMLYMRLNPVRIEFHRLGTNQFLISLAPGGPHDPKTWLIGSTSHGAGSTSGCSGCHGSSGSKPANYTDIRKGSGWCYKCHYGSGGHGNGIVHPLQ